MDFPYTVDDQAAFDKLVKDRIDRERAKFSDYEDLKAKAELVDSTKAEADTAIAEAVARAEAAESSLNDFKAEQETARQIEAWRAEVAESAGIPASALRGSTKEELEAHASDLKSLIATSSPVIPGQGDAPQGNAQSSPERDFLRELMGEE